MQRRIVVLALVASAALAPASFASASESPAVAPAVAAAPAAPASSGTGTYIVNVGAASLANAIWQYAVQQVKLNDNRSGLVQSLEEGAWYKTGQKHNIAVMVAPGGSTKGRFTTQFSGVVSDAVYHHDGYPPFRVVVFQTGTVTNNGDGGYINWQFRGWWDRNGMTVHFHNP